MRHLFYEQGQQGVETEDMSNNGLKILAIDQSSMGKLGYAVFDGSELVACGYREHKKTVKQRERLNLYAGLLQDLVKDWEPDVAIMELVRLFHADKIGFPTIVMMSKLIGIAEVIIPVTIPLWVVNTSSWKAAVLGNGRAPKNASVEYVQKVWDREENDDVADAICIGFYLVSQFRVGGPFEVKNVLELCR